jgi:hypothetical protein
LGSLLVLCSCVESAPRTERPPPQKVTHFRVLETLQGVTEKTLSAQTATLVSAQEYQLAQIQVQTRQPELSLMATTGHFKQGTLKLQHTHIQISDLALEMPVLEWERASSVLTAASFRVTNPVLQQSGVDLRVDLKRRKLFAGKTSSRYFY